MAKYARALVFPGQHRLLRYRCLLLAVLTLPALAQDSVDESFLEFLGAYQEVDGEMVDPYAFAENLEEMASMGGKQARKTEVKPVQSNEAEQHD